MTISITRSETVFHPRRQIDDGARTLRLFVSGRPADLSTVSLLTTAPEGDGRYRGGVLGTDALRRGFTVDFGAMQFRLE